MPKRVTRHLRPDSPALPSTGAPRPAGVSLALSAGVGDDRRWTVRFIRTRQVLDMIGVGRTTLWKMVQAGTFPRPVRITERSSGYLLDTVEQWMRLKA
jgi:prophage regulatory protein